MNFLAHLVLAPQTPRGLLGSIAPDMIRGPLPKTLDGHVMDAAQEHRRIDRFTDAHAAFQRTLERLRSVVDSRLAGVLADVLYDHVLAREWSAWREDGFESYIDETQLGLLDQIQLVPVRMQMIVRKMIDERWLLSYATAPGIRARLETMSDRLTRRVGRPMSLAISEQQLADVYAPVADDFAALWPDLKDFVARHRAAAGERLAS